MSVNKILLFVLGLFMIAAMLIFRPVPVVAEDKCNAVTGIVRSVSEGGINDVVFHLENHKTRYYINRGLEQGLTLEKLRNDLIGNAVTIKFPKYWTPLDPDNSVKHLSKISIGDQVIFNECKGQPRIPDQSGIL